MSETDLAAHAGSLSQFAGVRLVTLGDGAERGVRCLEFRTGTGFCFTVLVDRAMDIGDANFRGAALGWHSPTGFRSPSLHEHDSEEGLGWLRSFSGLLMTCGLDHALAPGEHDASHYRYPHRRTVRQPVHGRVALTPAQLAGYGGEWRGQDYVLWCEGVVTQAAVFGEHLQLSRRIETRLGSSSFVIKDQVVNRGFSKTPHMYLYHFNIGYPVLDQGSRYIAPVTECIWTAHEARRQGVGYRTQSGPQDDFVEQVYEFRAAADANGRVPVGLVNDSYGDGLGVVVEYGAKQLPCLLEWQCLQKGLYALGIEPSTNHALGEGYARERQQLQWLKHGEGRSYEVKFSVLDGTEAIKAHERRVAGIARQLTDEYAGAGNEDHA